MSIELHERVAVLESELEDTKLLGAKILKEISEIRGEINKYKGFIGAVWFIISCVGVFFSAIKFFHKG